MKYTTYSRYLPELADTINLQGLLDQLADFLLQSGFAGGAYSHPFWGEFGEDDADRSLDALRQAILQALMESGATPPPRVQSLRRAANRRPGPAPRPRPPALPPRRANRPRRV